MSEGMVGKNAVCVALRIGSLFQLFGVSRRIQTWSFGNDETLGKLILSGSTNTGPTRTDGEITASPGATQSRTSCSDLRGSTPEVRYTRLAGCISSVRFTDSPG